MNTVNLTPEHRMMVMLLKEFGPKTEGELLQLATLLISYLLKNKSPETYINVLTEILKSRE